MATLQNIGALKYRGKDGQWHPLPVVVQGASGGGGGVSTISGKGAPTSTTVGVVNQLYRDENTDKLYVCTSTDNGYTWAEVTADVDGVVKYTEQSLTNAQKAQARTNIGAGTSNFSGSYNDLTNKPNIPEAAQIDTTLTKSGQAADAKVVGDTLMSNTSSLLTEINKKASKSDIPSVPSWAMAASKPTYTAAEVGALPDTTVIPDVSGKVDKQQGTANAGKILGIGDDGVVAPTAKPTFTLTDAEKTAIAGQVVADGVEVTEVELPSGGGETWELIRDITFEEPVNTVDVSTDAEEQPFALLKMKVYAKIITYMDDKYTTIKYKINNMITVANITVGASSTSTNRCYIGYAEVDEEIGVRGLASGVDSKSERAMSSVINVTGKATFNAATITRIAITANDGAKPIGDVGTNIKIYGVKA